MVRIADGVFVVCSDRIAGANSEVNRLREQFNAGFWPVTAQTDIYAVCDMIKSWFRVLPEPVFPAYSYHDVINAMSTSCSSLVPVIQSADGNDC